MEDWTAKASAPGLDVEIRGGRRNDREYLVLALSGTPTLGAAVEKLSRPYLATPPLALYPWALCFELWRAAWRPWLTPLAPPRRD